MVMKIASREREERERENESEGQTKKKRKYLEILRVVEKTNED